MILDKLEGDEVCGQEGYGVLQAVLQPTPAQLYVLQRLPNGDQRVLLTLTDIAKQIVLSNGAVLDDGDVGTQHASYTCGMNMTTTTALEYALAHSILAPTQRKCEAAVKVFVHQPQAIAMPDFLQIFRIAASPVIVGDRFRVRMTFACADGEYAFRDQVVTALAWFWRAGRDVEDNFSESSMMRSIGRLINQAWTSLDRDGAALEPVFEYLIIFAPRPV